MRWQLWRRRRSDDDFEDEVRAHVALETDRLVDAGVDPRDARAAALRAFGNVAGARERFHDTHHWVWWEQFTRDLGYAWRGLWHSRAFVAATVLTLAVGLGLVTVVFTIFNAYVLRPFAIRDPYGIYGIVWHTQEAGGRTFRWSDYESISARNGPLRRGDCGRRALRDVEGQYPCCRLRLRQLLRSARSAHAARARTRAVRRGGDRRSAGRGVERPDLDAASSIGTLPSSGGKSSSTRRSSSSSVSRVPRSRVSMIHLRTSGYR